MAESILCFLQFETGHSPLAPECWLAETEVRAWHGTPPDWHWLEPAPRMPGAGLNTFEPGAAEREPVFARGSPPAHRPLDEARLFWPDASLHVVRTGGGCRWAGWKETAARGSDGAVRKVSRRPARPVLLRQDLPRRFSGIRELPGPAFQLVEYHENHRLIAWCLSEIPNPPKTKETP